MFKPLLLTLILIAGQSSYLIACAESSQGQSDILAFAQPQAAAVATGKAALEQETRQVEQQNHVMPGIAIYAHAFGGDEANRLAQDGVMIGSKSVDNYIELQSGNVLLNPENNIVVGTDKANIAIAAGAQVFISESSDDVVVYDLLQSKPNQVSVTVNKQKLVMEPGRMVVVTAQNSNDFEALDVNCHCVAYRNAVPLELKNKALKAFAANFSIASALTTIQPLQRLTVSHHKEDKLALEKLVKAAVVMGDFASSAAGATQVVNNVAPTQVADAK